MSSSSQSWSQSSKIGFRFIFIYFLLIICFRNNGAFPFWYKVTHYPFELLNQLIPWLGANFYGIEEEVSIKLTGSGDTMYDNLIVITSLLIALIGMFIWSLLDRHRDNYNKLYYWLTTAVRYYVALMLISYGLVKVIQLQFSYPGPYRMLSTIGETSPMGLAWTFLGFSKGYNMFMGTAELMAGLLLFRRTMTFGALVTLVTALNVMAVNYFYDVPVKLLSTHLVIMTLFLLARDIKRLVLFFFTNTHINLDTIKRPILSKGFNVAMNSIKAVLIGYVFIYGFINALDSQKIYGSKAPKPELYGVYEITNFVVNGDTITNYKNDQLWKTIAVQREGSLQVRKFNSSYPSYYGLVKDSLVDNRLKFTSWSNEEERFDFTYKKIDSSGLDFDFIYKGDTIKGTSKRLRLKDFTLTNRGFHWISEYPYNR